MYLRRLYRHSKPAFWALLLFLTGQAFFTYKGVETFPFFLYGMYSEPLPEREEYSVVRVCINDQPVSLWGWGRFSADFVQHNLLTYERLTALQGEDPIEAVARRRFGGLLSAERMEAWLARWSNRGRMHGFLPWLRRYWQPVYGQPIRSVELRREHYRYAPSGGVELLRTEPSFAHAGFDSE